MYKSLESNNGKFAKGNKHSPLAPVILGRDAQSVPRIFWQQGSNLVNKLALLLHKCWGRGFNVFSASTLSVILRRYSLLEVPWRRIHNVIAKAMSICVAVGNKVMDTRLPQPAGCGDKYDVSGFGYRLLRRYTPRNDGASNGEGWHRPWCQKILGTRPRMTGGRDANSFGRSMIEMLGVLAIIAVLSVGGIAGYSKAMLMWRSNIQRQMLTEVITAAIKMKSHLDAKTKKWEDITPTLEAMGDIPEGVTYKDGYLYDKSGIRFRMYYGFQPWTNADGTKDGETRCSVWFEYNQNGAKFVPEVQEFCRNLALACQQDANDVISINYWFSTSSHSKGTKLYTGKTLQTTTISEITTKCNQTFEESGNIVFELILNPY